jgi:putative NADH-flavin reductase
MRILVIGATGGTGREIVAQALAVGDEVTALARKPEKMRVTHDRLRVVRGDVLDYGSVEAAMRRQDAVLCALGHKRWLYPTRILSRGTDNIVHAMKAIGVRRLVCETSLGVGDSFARMGLYYTLFVIPFILPFYFWDKDRQEQVVRASTLDWVIVRPGALTNGRARGQYRHGPDVGSRLWTVRISRADVAAFMLKQVREDTYLRSTPGLSW